MSLSFLEAAGVRSTDASAESIDVLALLCACCQTVIAAADELLCAELPRCTDSVWTYELDMLDQTASVYSATNPAADRFDVARLGGACCSRLRFSGEPVADFSWFPPFRWINCQCPGCPAQLGWVFVADDEDGRTPPPTFAGVILTKLREARVRPGRLAIPDPGAPRRFRGGEQSTLLGDILGNQVAGDPRSQRVRLLDHLIEAGAPSESLLDMWRQGWSDERQPESTSPDELLAEMRAEWTLRDSAAVEAAPANAVADEAGE